MFYFWYKALTRPMQSVCTNVPPSTCFSHSTFRLIYISFCIFIYIDAYLFLSLHPSFGLCTSYLTLHSCTLLSLYSYVHMQPSAYGSVGILRKKIHFEVWVSLATTHYCVYTARKKIRDVNWKISWLHLVTRIDTDVYATSSRFYRIL